MSEADKDFVIAAGVLKEYKGSAVSIKIPDGVVEISDRCFDSLKGLRVVYLPDGVETIGKEAFFGCAGLTTINFPGSLKQIRNNAFGCCRSLKRIVLPDTGLDIWTDAFGECDSVTEIRIPGRVTAVNAFYHCANLKTVYLEEGLKVLPADFNDCDSLEKIVFPNSLEEIQGGAFKNCRKLKRVDFVSGLKRIGAHCFEGCSSLETVTLPDTITDIDPTAFNKCDNLKKVIVPSGLLPEMYVLSLPPRFTQSKINMLGREYSSDEKYCHEILGKDYVIGSLYRPSWVKKSDLDELSRRRVEIVERYAEDRIINGDPSYGKYVYNLKMVAHPGDEVGGIDHYMGHMLTSKDAVAWVKEYVTEATVKPFMRFNTSICPYCGKRLPVFGTYKGCCNTNGCPNKWKDIFVNGEIADGILWKIR